MNVPCEWPFNNSINETSISINQRMVCKMIVRRDNDPSEFYTEVGPMIRRNREAQHLSMRQASTIMGLDSGFLCLLEQGHAFYHEVNQVWDRLVGLDLVDHGYTPMIRIDFPWNK